MSDLLGNGLSNGSTLDVFDADSHIVEPATIWDDHLDPEYRALVRSSFWHIEDEFGRRTVLNGRPVPELSPGPLPRYGLWRPGLSAVDVGDLDPDHAVPVNPGAVSADDRIADMDLMGVHQTLIFPTLFAEYFPLVHSPDVAAVLARAYNEWITEFCRFSPDRLFAVGILPLQDVGLAVAEARRLAEEGFRAVLLRPVFTGDRYPTERYFWPLWAELERLALAVCIHASPGPAASEFQANAGFVDRVTTRVDLGHPVAEFLTPAMDNGGFLVSLLANGLLEKFPAIRLCFSHSGTGWLLVALEKAETYLWLSTQADPVSLEPEHVFFDRANLVSFSAGDGTVRRLADGVLGATAAWGSRYPSHDTTTPVDAVKDLSQGGVSEEVIAQLMGGNARTCLGLSQS
jgi:uncharacterized protein